MLDTIPGEEEMTALVGESRTMCGTVICRH